MSGLLKTGLKTSLLEALYNEVVSNTNSYYYFIGRPVEWPTDDPESVPSPEDTMSFENEVRNEMVFFKKISPGDLAYTIDRYDWAPNTVFDMYDDRLGRTVAVAGCVGGSGVNRLVITTTPWISEGAVNVGDVLEFDERVYVVIGGVDGDDVGTDLNLASIPPTHTSGVQQNGEALLRFEGYDLFNPSIIEIGMLVKAPGVAPGARVVGVEGDTVTLSSANVSQVNGVAEFVIVSSTLKDNLQDSKFYCITSDYNVYKCLDNNGGSPSIVKPFSTTHEPISLSDGYVWKYMYTIPRYLVNKFLTPVEAPVTTALKNQYYSRGSIAQVNIVNRGSGYGPETQLEVVGDGHIDGNTYKILGCDVLFPGSGYSASPLITVEAPFDGIEFQPLTEYVAGQYVKVTSTNKIYQVVAPGLAGETPPDHTRSDPVYNGSVSFRFVGLTTQASANVDGGVLESIGTSGIVGFINVTTPGYGYTTAPQVAVTSVGSGSGAEAVAQLTYNPATTTSTLWTSGGVVVEGDLIRYSDRLYRVTSAVDGPDDGLNVNLGTEPPIHISGTQQNGETDLVFLGRIPSVSVGRVSNITLTNRGSEYTTPPSIDIEPPIPDDQVTDWVAEASVAVGDIIHHDGNYYRVVYETGDLGTSPPTHTVGIRSNGANVDLEFIAQQAVAVAEIYRGFGYDYVPSVSVESPVEAGVSMWTPAGIVDGGDVIRYGSVFYEVDGSDNEVSLGDDPPTHSEGTETNGDASLTVISRVIKWSPPFNEVAVEVNGGDYVQHLNAFYVVDGTDDGLSLGEIPPFHQEGSEINGTASLTFIGLQATATVSTEKTSAVVAPIIDIEAGQISGVVIVDGGVGYTTASIRVSAQTGQGAELLVDTAFGELDTRQANIELLAVPGSISALRIINPGAGYASAQITIVGDGTGCVVQPIINDVGSIEKVVIINPGIGYTKAQAIIEGSGTDIVPAYARCIVSPATGHGKNAIRELFARQLTIATTVAADKNQGVEVFNDYTQVGLIKNPQQFSSTLFATASTGSACFSVAGNFNYSQILIDDILTDINGKQFRVVARPPISPTETIWPVLLQSLDNSTPIAGEPLAKQGVEGVVATASSVTLPTVDKYSGDLLFIDNLAPFEPTDQQTITLKTTIKL